MTESATQVQVIEETPAYWRVVFDYPPFNIVDASIFEALQDLLVRMDASPSLRVVMFESANPEFYLAHFDLTGKAGNITTAVGPSGLPILTDTFVRLTKSPVVSIAKIRGRVRGVSSEFVLACDMRFASRENTLLGQPEVGVGVNPGGGGTERLPLLVGRGRALEIVLGANDFDGDTAERYGYVNRALPDAELDGFVDALARRSASIDEIYTEDCVFYDPSKGVYRGRDEIDRIAGAIKATHPEFRYQPITEPAESGNGGLVRWVSGRPGEAPAYAGTDFIIAQDGRIAAVYLFFDKLP